MTTDWWARQLSGSKTEQPTRTSLPPVTPPMRTAIRIPQQVQHQQPQHQQQVLDPNREPGDQINMGDAIRLWKGGEAARRETNSCPECGSGLVFSRAKGTLINGAAPAPRCYECGWNGRYSQADQSNWA